MDQHPFAFHTLEERRLHEEYIDDAREQYKLFDDAWKEHAESARYCCVTHEVILVTAPHKRPKDWADIGASPLLSALLLLLTHHHHHAIIGISTVISSTSLSSSP